MEKKTSKPAPGTDYSVSAQAAWAKTFKDAPGASKILLDVLDEQLTIEALEPVEDAIAGAVEAVLAQTLANVQAKMGKYAKFAGDLADDADAATDFLIAEADAMVNAGALELPMDMAMSVLKPYIVKALEAQQLRLAEVQFPAED